MGRLFSELMTEPKDSHPASKNGGVFATTRWSVVLRAGQDGEGDESQRSLELLCQSYWYPVYAFVRRFGKSPHDAQDLTQGFFADILEKRFLAKADPARGRFRSFLLAAVRNYLGNEWQKETAAKRGGTTPPISLDAALAEQRFAIEPVTTDDPESIYERAWAVSVIELALDRIAREQAETGKAVEFEKLRPFLAGEHETSYADLSRELATTEGALRVAVHRLRQRYRELLRATIAETVDDPSEAEGELEHLRRVLSR